MTIHSDSSAGDLSRLRIDRDAAPRRPWLLWIALAILVAAGVVFYPRAMDYVATRRAPEVEIARATQVIATPGGSTALPVLVATGYVVARHSSDVGVKIGGRLGRLRFEEGTRVREGDVLAEIEHADIDAQVEASRRAIVEAETQLAQAIALRDEDARNVERQHALARDGITTTATLTGAEATAAVSAARVKSAEAAIESARARLRYAMETLENTNVRAPFNGVVIKKRAEVGETVSPFGVQGQASREGGAIATIADLGELEVQTEVSENNVAKLKPAMPAEVKLQAYQDRVFKGRLRQIFPSADRAKSIVEVRVSILDADATVKPEMTASVTFQENRAKEGQAGDRHLGPAAAADRPGAEAHRGGARRPADRLGRDGGRREAPRGNAGARASRSGGSEERRRAGRDADSESPSGIDRSRGRAREGDVAMALIELREVSKSYRRDAIEIPVLDRVSITVPEGDYLGLMGPSGSGKSTLLNLLAGIDRPTRGSVRIGDTEIGGLSERALAAWRARNIGFIFQLYNLIPVLTAFENVELPLLLTSLSKAQRRDHVMTALNIVGLGDRAQHYPRQLSGGQEQRVAIARAIVTDPKLLLADEPTGDLDAKSAGEVLTLLQRLNQEYKKTIVMVTHDPHAAERASHLLHLEKGTLVEQVKA
ncbi:MAG: efflux RND transporter periplasmic adaptor subunit [Acidobacteria bacterium]|nr:efflux RND transporter periplasmic adaptor subunit [Acidobacteriota bacterium]